MNGSRIDAMHRFLWLSVIERAYQDAEGMDPMVEGPELVRGVRDEAREWLCSEAFMDVGELAGVVGDKVERKLQENRRKYGIRSAAGRDPRGVRGEDTVGACKTAFGASAYSMETGGCDACGTDECEGGEGGDGSGSGGTSARGTDE